MHKIEKWTKLLLGLPNYSRWQNATASYNIRSQYGSAVLQHEDFSIVILLQRESGRYSRINIVNMIFGHKHYFYPIMFKGHSMSILGNFSQFTLEFLYQGKSVHQFSLYFSFQVLRNFLDFCGGMKGLTIYLGNRHDMLEVGFELLFIVLEAIN